ncbi:hypothetical protein ACJX0J_005440, partial [Zea mays]
MADVLCSYFSRKCGFRKMFFFTKVLINGMFCLKRPIKRGKVGTHANINLKHKICFPGFTGHAALPYCISQIDWSLASEIQPAGSISTRSFLTAAQAAFVGIDKGNRLSDLMGAPKRVAWPGDLAPRGP